ncbi:Phage integrase family protein [Albimonas donghaensis]|uniref:Phage integrase family protein n=1 Tax=Albimonas donghaensis TaxID=356660 RepID=A0A1H2W0F2_9RHOB|nr:tyrosine-type recombinase/integrase [Albimonas donghaensis]SDW73907.1 Phage integrase family protein [Albimonas donghaensis]
MSRNPSHIIRRGNSFVYSRRVPARAVEGFGKAFVRVSLGTEASRAQFLSERLSAKLEAIWASPEPCPVELAQLVSTVAPKSFTLLDAVGAYLNERGAGKGASFGKHTQLTAELLLNVAGNKDVRSFDRDDARAFLRLLQGRGVKTGTIRRRMNTAKALLEFAYAECDAERRNPFSKLRVPGEGLDAVMRGTFSKAELSRAYAEAFASGSDVALLAPLLGETGARLAEIVGLRWQDIFLDHEIPHIWIRPHSGRRLKTQASERRVPLVGEAFRAASLLASPRDPEGDKLDALYPRYWRDGTVMATHASNAIGKWLKRRFEGKTAHCMRHTMRDRLREVGAPMDMIDQIGGWSAARSVGSGYGKGYDLERVRSYLGRCNASLVIVEYELG